jgi:hypothetical protein
MLNTIATVNEVFIMLKEPFDPSLTAPSDLSHWSRATILNRLNMVQDELVLEMPDLFKTLDESLTTATGQATYTVPSTMGTIRNVAVNGIQLIGTTKEAIQADAIRGDLVDATEFVQNWQTITGTPYMWYQDINGIVLGLYPIPVSSGLVITIEGEYILAEMADTTASYSLNNIAALRKAQKILIYKTVEVCAIEDGNIAFGTYLHQAAEKLVESLRTYWFVLKPSDPSSTIKYKETEGPTTQTLRREVR